MGDHRRGRHTRPRPALVLDRPQHHPRPLPFNPVRLFLDPPFNAPPAFGRFPAPLPGLGGLPVDGGYGTVDAAAHDPRADSPDDFTFGSGPARRYVGVLTRGGPVGRSAPPGGTSALPADRHYLDLLPAYLTDDSYPVRVTDRDLRRATESVPVLRP